MTIDFVNSFEPLEISTCHSSVACPVPYMLNSAQHTEKSKKKLQKLLVVAYRALPDGPHHQIESIPGIGEVTAAILVAKVISIDRFPSPGCLVGYFGIFPEAKDFGSLQSHTMCDELYA